MTIARALTARSAVVRTTMPARGPADAGGGQHPLALDLDHAGAAVAVGAIARRVGVAEVRDPRPLALRHLPDALAGRGGDLAPVEGEGDGSGHGHPGGQTARRIRSRPSPEASISSPAPRGPSRSTRRNPRPPRERRAPPRRDGS